MNSPNVAALSTASRQLNVLPTTHTGLSGRCLRAMTNVSMPTGTLMANSHGHGATARMAAESVGPATEAMATTVALSPTPSPRRRLG